MSKQLAIILPGFFFNLILATSAQETCRLDAAMSIWNDYYGRNLHLLFQGSNVYQINVYFSPKILSYVNTFAIKKYWKNWSGRVTRAMSWRDDKSPNQWPAIIGNNETTHFTRFSKSNTTTEADPNSYEIWPEQSMKQLTVEGFNPSRAVLLSSYEPGYVLMYHEATETIGWSTVGIDSTSIYKHFIDKSERNIFNPDITEWLNNFVQTKLKLIGVLKLGWKTFCRGGWQITTMKCQNVRNKTDLQVDYQENFVVFIQDNNTVKHCFGLMFFDNRRDCLSLERYVTTDTALFGGPFCGKTESKTSITTKMTIEPTIGEETKDKTTSGSTKSEITTEMTTEPMTISNDRKNKIHWTLGILFATLIIIILIICYSNISKRNQKHQYKLLKEKVIPRKAKDVKLFESSESESEKSV